MRLSALRTVLWITVVGGCIQGQNPPAKDAPAVEAHGLPPRVAATDYQFQEKAGDVTIAAEFDGHSVPTAQGTFSTEDYVVVEAALFGTPDARAKLSIEDFTLRLNEKKTLPSQPYALVFHSLKDPEWEPPASAEKSKTSIGTGGGGRNDAPPTPPKMPIELRRAMEQKVQKAAMPEGDRPLPQAGLLFFEHRGKPEHLKSIELIYSGPAGKATLTLQP